MSYPDPRYGGQGFPVATDIFPNDPGLEVDGPDEWKRELPPFGPQLVPFIDGRMSDLERAINRLIDAWSYQSVTFVDFATMQADGSGNIDSTTVPNAALYDSPAGFTFALHRLAVSVGGSNFGTPYTAAASYWEIRVGGATVDGGSLVSGQGSFPVVKTWGTRDAPRVRSGETLSLFVVGGAGLASKTVTVRIQGTLDRTQEG